MGVVCQLTAPAQVVVSSDNDLPEITELVRECSREFGRPLAIVQRPNMGECRVGQARNNGVRALLASGARDVDRILYLDGDCCPAADVANVHLQRSAALDLLIGFRVELTQRQTEEFSEDLLRDRRLPVQPTSEQLASLARRDAKYRRQLLLRKIGLTKPHKPKLLSAHFSTSVAAMRRINGFDEEFIGWGQEDDDLGRRLHASGARAGIVIREAVVLHQWHPTRAPGKWADSAGVERFAKNLPWRCERGIENPVDQPPPVLRRFEGGRETDRREIAPAGRASRVSA